MHQPSHRTVRQSLLDRLVQNDAPEPRTWEESVELLKVNLLRDLEKLLNTRESGDPAGPPHEELERSVYNYGLPDLASLSAESAKTPQRLVRSIEREIELYEPRLTNVRISLKKPDKKSSKRHMQFMIEATLRLEPDPERVEFDTVLELDSGQIRIGD